MLCSYVQTLWTKVDAYLVLPFCVIFRNNCPPCGFEKYVAVSICSSIKTHHAIEESTAAL